MAGDVVEIVAVDEEFGDGEEGGKLLGGKGFPCFDGASVLVFSGEDGESRLFFCPGEGVGIVAGVGQFDADGIGVHADVADACFWVFPAGSASVESYLGEGDGLEDSSVAVDGEVGGDAALAHGVDGGAGGCAAGKMDDQGAADREGAVAGELDFFCGVQPVGGGDFHGLAFFDEGGDEDGQAEEGEGDEEEGFHDFCQMFSQPRSWMSR